MPEEQPEFTVAIEVLRTYAGNYTSPVAPIKVRLGDDRRLTLQFGDQKPAPLIAISETEFRPDGVDARILFEKGGKVEALRLRQGGRELPASPDTGPRQPEFLKLFGGLPSLAPGRQRGSPRTDLGPA